METYSFPDCESDTILISEEDMPNQSANNIETESMIQTVFKWRRFITFSEDSLEIEDEKLNSPNFLAKSSRPSDIDIVPQLFQSVDDFFHSLPLSKIIHNNNEADVTFNQLRRDIQRDKCSINGTLLCGSLVGLDGILSVFADNIDRSMVECGLSLLRPDQKYILSLEILKKTSRTNSGGSSFTCLHEFVSNVQSGCVIIPDSQRASPSKIRIAVEAIGKYKVSCLPLEPCWGLNFDVECDTYFMLKCLDDTNLSISRSVRVSYNITIGFAIDIISLCVPSKLIVSMPKLIINQI